MKTSSMAVLVVWSSVFLLGFVVRSDTPMPVEPQSMVGSWVGYQAGELYFYRLTLAGDGKGSCVALYNDQAADRYLIPRWWIQDNRLSIHLAPRDRGSEPIEAVVTGFDPLRIDMKLMGLSNRWQRSLTLYNEHEWNKRTSRARKHSSRE